MSKRILGQTIGVILGGVIAYVLSGNSRHSFDVTGGILIGTWLERHCK